MGMLKKAASGVPCLRRSGYAQAGRPFAVLTYESTFRAPKGLRPYWGEFFDHSPQFIRTVSS
jgi:hypothetical protein